VELQLVTFHEQVSGSLSQSLVNVIKAGLDKMIPVRTPAYQSGNFQEILVTLDPVLCFNFWLFSPHFGSPCIGYNFIPIH
jgi:Cft2 family RNA processing exonuclease